MSCVMYNKGKPNIYFHPSNFKFDQCKSEYHVCAIKKIGNIQSKRAVSKYSCFSLSFIFYLTSSHSQISHFSFFCPQFYPMQPLPTPLIVLALINMHEICDLVSSKVERLNAAYVNIYFIWFPLLLPFICLLVSVDHNLYFLLQKKRY